MSADRDRETAELLVMPPDVRKRLQEQLDAIARSERQAAIDAHKVWLR